MKCELEPYNRGMPDATLLDDLRGVARKLGKDYVTIDEYNEHGRWYPSTPQRRFGGWCKAHELAGPKKVRNYDATAEDCVRDIERVAETLGKTTLTTSEYERYGTFSLALIRRRCGSWEAAIERAVLIVSPLYHKRKTDEQLFENLEHLWEVLGRQPKTCDFVQSLSQYSYDCYKRRFGSLRKALEVFVASFENHEPGQSEAPPKETVVDTSLVAAAKHHGTSRTIGWRMRFLVARRDAFRCRICGISPALKPGTVLVVDHIVPWAAPG
jgi:hypothetical protein